MGYSRFCLNPPHDILRMEEEIALILDYFSPDRVASTSSSLIPRGLRWFSRAPDTTSRGEQQLMEAFRAHMVAQKLTEKSKGVSQLAKFVKYQKMVEHDLTTRKWMMIKMLYNLTAPTMVYVTMSI